MTVRASSSGSGISVQIVLGELASRLAKIHETIKAFEEDTLDALESKSSKQLNSATYQEFDRALQMQGDIVSVLHFLSGANTNECVVDLVELNCSVKLESSFFYADGNMSSNSDDRRLDHASSKPVEVF